MPTPHELPTRLTYLRRQIGEAMQADRFRLQRELQSLERALAEGKSVEQRLERLSRDVVRSAELLQRRKDHVPHCRFDLDLPILEKRQELGAAIQQHQVLVVCGETGSGKSTQLPKICLDIGRGVRGFIGHTQPRRVAARTIAARLAEELGSPLGQDVGFQVRFTDTTRPETYIKLMTDGILLAETQGDRFLDRYDTLILDEAHERSLNVDFLLGYLKRLLPKRRDLRLIITSATIDAESFARHFRDVEQEVPIIEVSGRTYPVEVRYRPPEATAENEETPPLADQIADAAVELSRAGPGDILAFLPTEREILEVAKILRGRSFPGAGKVEILPLYARLSVAEQNRVFHPSSQRRIVLATNVAESSLTVPGIRYVIDTGTARISRYAPRSKVQRLPIEAISQASADQRKGRCGRLGPGICIRLYGKDDYASRDRYTTPEIRRTNLAAVILRMLALRLGSIDDFPFLDAPRPDAVNDGYRTLFELGAIDEERRLTDIGQRLGRLPIDPRLGRMIVAAADEGCLHEMLIIAAALEVQDPRDRPLEKQKSADERHAQFAHEESDFCGYLKLWDFYHGLRGKLSRSQLQKACQQNFLSLPRLREWQDVHRQLLQLVQETGVKVGPRRDNYDAIHRALLCGLLSNIALRRDKFDYEGAGGATFFLWPGSAAFAKNPRWVVAGELVETTRRYLRTVGRIQPEWIEPLAAHLVKRSYSDPFWSRNSGCVLAYEKVTLFGLPVVTGRRAPFGEHDPKLARHLFIQQALIAGDVQAAPRFLKHNQRLLDEVQSLGAKSRATHYLIGEGVQYAFYDARLPADVRDVASLQRWLKEGSSRAANPHEDALKMTVADLIGEADEHDRAAFPDQLDAGALQLDIAYRFQPGETDDGLTITVPREAVQQLDPRRLEWLVPGHLEEKLTALIRSLPKALRRGLIPAPDVAKKAAQSLEFASGDFLAVAARVLSQIAGEPIPTSAFQLDQLPLHLRMNVRVVGEQGELLAEGRDLDVLRKELGLSTTAASQTVTDKQWERDGITSWNIGELPESVEVGRGDFRLTAYPTLIDRGQSVSLRLLATREAAEYEGRAGWRRLFALAEQRELKSQIQWLPRLNEICLFASSLRYQRDLREQLIDLLADLSFVQGQPLPRDPDAFEAARKRGRQQMLVAVQEISKLMGPLFESYHQARVKLDAATAPAWRDAVADMREQLARLMPEGFLVDVDWSVLQHYPRYLQAISIRLEKLRTAGPQRDRQAWEQLRPHWERYVTRTAQDEPTAPNNRELAAYRWLLEEYRVSLFAQQLGAAVKVSPQRLEKQWSQV